MKQLHTEEISPRQQEPFIIRDGINLQQYVLTRWEIITEPGSVYNSVSEYGNILVEVLEFLAFYKDVMITTTAQ